MTRLLHRLGVALALTFMTASVAFGQATVPTVFNTAGQRIPAQAHICVDLTGAYVGCGAGGGGGGSTTFTATAAAPTYVEGSATNPGSVNLTGDLRTIAKQSGTWVLGLSAGTNNIGDVDVLTLPALAAGANTIGSISNISGTVSLPTGAATAALQSSTQVNLGGTVVNRNALYDASGVIYDLSAPAGILGVNGTTIATLANRFPVDSGVAQGSTTAGQSGDLIQCAVTTAAPTYTTAQTSPLSCDTGGLLRVSGGGGGVVTQPTAANLNATVVGSGPVSNGTAQAGSALIGGVFNTTTPTLTTGQQAAAQANSRGVLKMVVSDGATDVAPGNGNGDARSSATAALPVGGNTYGYNSAGNTWDRARTANNSLNTTGTGVLSSQVVGQCDDTSPTALTENSFGNARMSCNNHALVTRPFETQANTWNYAAAASGISNTTTAVTVKAADAANRNCLTSFQLSSDALGAATEFAVRDGAGGTVLWRTKIGTAGYVNGYQATLPSPVCGTANTLLEIVTLTASITGAVYFNGQGYVAP